MIDLDTRIELDKVEKRILLKIETLEKKVESLIVRTNQLRDWLSEAVDIMQEIDEDVIKLKRNKND